MLVKDIMTRQVVAIGPDMPIGDVNLLMEQRNIRHFPIVEDDRLVGVVSDRDLRTVGSQHPKAPAGVSYKDAVANIMVTPVVTAHPLDPVEEASKVLRDRKIGALPVMQDDKLVGIITGIDVLEAFTQMSGVYGATTRLTVELENRPGALARLLEHIAERNTNVASVLTTNQEPDATTVVLRVGTIDGRGLANALREEGFSVLWPQEK